MTEPKKKLTLTRAAIEAAKPPTKPPVRFVANLDATNISATELAAALRALADAVEGHDLAGQVEALRLKVVARDPELATTTRLELPARRPFAISVGDQVVGQASYVDVQEQEEDEEEADEFETYDEWDAAANEGDEEELEDEPEPEYEEDDAIEFWRHDKWHSGVVLDRSGPFTYIVEDERRQRWEVNTASLRLREED